MGLIVRLVLYYVLPVLTKVLIALNSHLPLFDLFLEISKLKVANLSIVEQFIGYGLIVITVDGFQRQVLFESLFIDFVQMGMCFGQNILLEALCDGKEFRVRNFNSLFFAVTDDDR